VAQQWSPHRPRTLLPQQPPHCGRLQPLLSDYVGEEGGRGGCGGGVTGAGGGGGGLNETKQPTSTVQ